MAKRRNIVAAELLNVRDKFSLLDAIAFPLAGDAIAGLAGAWVGASLIPSKLIYSWRVLYDDGSYEKLKYNGDDPRNDWLMEMPYLPEYEAFIESEKMMTELYHDYQPVASIGTINNTGVPNTTTQTNPQQAQASNGHVVIGPGYYQFGGNFPVGVFNMEYLSGKGMLELKDKDGWLSEISFGEQGDANSYFGLSSGEYKSFNLDGNVQLKVTRAGMIQI